MTGGARGSSLIYTSLGKTVDAAAVGSEAPLRKMRKWGDSRSRSRGLSRSQVVISREGETTCFSGEPPNSSASSCFSSSFRRGLVWG